MLNLFSKAPSVVLPQIQPVIVAPDKFESKTLTNISYYAAADFTEHLATVSAESLVFYSKDEYLKWVRDWKQKYSQITQCSRKAKVARKQSRPTYDSSAVGAVMRYKAEAKGMLWLRSAAKKKSWAQKTKKTIMQS